MQNPNDRKEAIRNELKQMTFRSASWTPSQALVNTIPGVVIKYSRLSSTRAKLEQRLASLAVALLTKSMFQRVSGILAALRKILASRRLTFSP